MATPEVRDQRPGSDPAVLRKNYLLRRMSEAVTRTSEAASRQERGERPNHSQGEGVYVCVQGGDR
ncbi:hypothetical protein C0Q70_10210 [Pomacea canaliculata]|uniref:Uncharacterized protein n=1 Tax=Pomacea canaliculata TaxID=400727 RepID=A0A2T7PBZ3_POMCA|nr:hypothetical protein C0Q70_10210 [Pomacea canaliculata]